MRRNRHGSDMSLFGTLNTGVSGMAAQANVLSATGDNIANAATAGYKRASVDFASVLGSRSTSSYTAGGVQAQVRYGISAQGSLTSTASATDLAIKGGGFFVVRGENGSTALTRAGSFVPDAAGDLVNTAGYRLMGYNLKSGAAATANGTGGLEVINLSKQALAANPSTTGSLIFNASSNAKAIATADPGTNANPISTSKTSVAAFDDLGDEVTLDVYLSKTAANTGTVTTYDQRTATAGGFPYTATPTAPAPLSSHTLTYSGTTGKLVSVATGGTVSTTDLSLAIAIPGGKPLTLAIGRSTQLASDFAVSSATVDGSPPSKLDHVTIAGDGTVTSVFTDGITQAAYRIPLADVPSEDRLTPVTGNVYEPNLASGTMTIGLPQTGSLGLIQSNALESSTVDLAAELTAMISAQRSYQANSKVVQTSSALLKVVDQLSG